LKLRGLRHGSMQFDVFVSDRGVQFLSEVCTQVLYLDQLLNVGKIFQAMRSAHPRSEFEFDQLLQSDRFDSVDIQCRLRRVRKSDGFRQTVSRIFSGRNNLNTNIPLCRAKLFSRTLKSWAKPERNQFFVKTFQALFREQQVDVLSKTPVSMLIQCDRSDHGVINAAIIQLLDNSL